MSRWFGFVVSILLCFALVSAANVAVEVEIYSETTIFNYNFDFNEEDSYSSFSFEKPQDARIIYVRNQLDEPVDYSVAGDYFIIKPQNTQGETFTVKFTSRTLSNEVKNQGVFSSYLNFNFPVSSLDLKMYVQDDFGEVKVVSPRNYQFLENSTYSWALSDLEQDTLFLINFGDMATTNGQGSFIGDYLLILIFFPVLLFAIFLFFILRSGKKEEEKEEVKKEVKEELKKELAKEEKKEKKVDKKEEEKAEEKEKKEEKEESKEVNAKEFKQIAEKYLTENEREVVDVVKKNEGISQYDILNHLPKLTKSNLSKIITKLNNRKFLSRIRVGKVNKIYLGDKLKVKGKVEEDK